MLTPHAHRCNNRHCLPGVSFVFELVMVVVQALLSMQCMVYRQVECWLTKEGRLVFAKCIPFVLDCLLAWGTAQISPPDRAAPQACMHASWRRTTASGSSALLLYQRTARHSQTATGTVPAVGQARCSVK
jgi:hypothetical protein